MNSIMMILSSSVYSPAISTVTHHLLPCTLPHCSVSPSVDPFSSSGYRSRRRLDYSSQHTIPTALSSSASAGAGAASSEHHRDGTYSVGDFMTQKEDLHVVKPTTTVDEALETLVEKRITGFPVIDDEWNLVGVVSDYDLLALDSISGGGHQDTNLFPDVDSSWKTFNEIQKLLGKTNGKLVGDLMTPAPLVVRENTNLEDAVRLLLETKFRRLPVVDGDGKLVGIITRGNVVRGALKIKRDCEKT